MRKRFSVGSYRLVLETPVEQLERMSITIQPADWHDYTKLLNLINYHQSFSGLFGVYWGGISKPFPTHTTLGNSDGKSCYQ